MTWLVRALIRLYPASFRSRYGRDMEESFADAVRLGAARGRVWAWLAAAVASADLLFGVVREHRRRPVVGTGIVSGGRGRREIMRGWLRDMRLAARQLRAQPVFVIVAAGSIAIGIGANTAVFSIAYELLLRPLGGIENHDRVVELGRTSQGRGFDSFTYPDFSDIRDQVPALEGAAAYTVDLLSVSPGLEGMRAMGHHVSPGYFDVLGATPALGRFFRPDEREGTGRHPVVVVDHAFWRTELGGRPDAVGSTLYVNRIPHTIVGVTSEEFRGHMVGFMADLYIPLAQYPATMRRRELLDDRGSSWHQALGVLAEGATLADLDAQLQGLTVRLAEAYPETNERRGFRAMPLGPVPGAGREGIRLFLAALLGMVGLILVVTCTNVAGMFLSRATARGREVAVRQALGAGRPAIVQQLTAETLLVFVIGGGLGIGLGLWAVGTLNPSALPFPFPLRLAFEPHWPVVGLALFVTLATGLLFGLLPAARASRPDVITAIKDDGRVRSRGAGRARGIFVRVQIALSLVLLVTAGLFVRSLQKASGVETGFDPEGSYVTYLDLDMEGYDQAGGARLQAELLAALRAEPWVVSAALASDLPMDLSSSGTSVLPDGWEATEESPRFAVDNAQVSDGYFETLAIPLLAGRPLAAGDHAEARRVAVVNETFANEAWPGEDAIGRAFEYRRFSDTPRGGGFTVVGVVADVKNQLITDPPKPFMYLPISQVYSAGFQVVVNTAAPADAAVAGLREVVRSVDPNLSIGAIQDLPGLTSLGTLPQRLAAWLTTALALVALLLSGMGVYGVVSSVVTHERREIGIRMALGAELRTVVTAMLRRGLGLAAPGIVLGGLAAVLTGRALRALLLDLSPADPVAFSTVAALLLSVVALASWIPARRAARIQPADTLRQS